MCRSCKNVGCKFSQQQVIIGVSKHIKIDFCSAAAVLFVLILLILSLKFGKCIVRIIFPVREGEGSNPFQVTIMTWWPSGLRRWSKVRESIFLVVIPRFSFGALLLSKHDNTHNRRKLALRGTWRAVNVPVLNPFHKIFRSNSAF
jgi:hypothetical protein